MLYETHSRFTCENEEMAMSVVSELNNYAADVHLEELRKTQGEAVDKTTTGECDSSEAPVVRLDEDLVLPVPTPTVVVR